MKGEKSIMKNSFASLAKKSMQNMIIIGALAILVLIFWALNPYHQGFANIFSQSVDFFLTLFIVSFAHKF